MSSVVGALACSALLGLVACGDKPDSADIQPAVTNTTVTASAENEPSLPVHLVDDSGTDVVITSVERIIPVDGDLAEIVFALGLGEFVVATDLSATYPPAADALPQIGYQRSLVAEPIAAFEPTVVLATDLARPVEVLAELRALKIPVVLVERQTTLDGPAAKVRAVARALGVPERGEALVAAMQVDIDAALLAAAATDDHPRVLVLYLRGAQTQLIFGKGSGVEVILEAVGAVDVAAEMGIGETQPISAESLIVAAPDVLIVSTTGLESVGGIDGLVAIPGLGRTPAGEQRRVLAFEDQYLFGGGPRFGQLLLELTAALHPNPYVP